MSDGILHGVHPARSCSLVLRPGGVIWDEATIAGLTNLVVCSSYRMSANGASPRPSSWNLSVSLYNLKEVAYGYLSLLPVRSLARSSVSGFRDHLVVLLSRFNQIAICEGTHTPALLSRTMRDNNWFSLHSTPLPWVKSQFSRTMSATITRTIGESQSSHLSTATAYDLATGEQPFIPGVGPSSILASPTAAAVSTRLRSGDEALSEGAILEANPDVVGLGVNNLPAQGGRLLIVSR